MLALLQKNVKRLLAYSSIAHVGYLTVAVVAGGTLVRTAVAFYLPAYSLTLIAAFGVISVLSREDSEPETLEDYRGLGRRHPGLTAVLTIALLSLAGIPVTAGFIGKFFVVEAGAAASQWGLLIVLALTSALSLYYYLRLVIIMFSDDAAPTPGVDVGFGRSEPGTSRAPDSVGAGPVTDRRLAAVTLAVLTLFTLLLGVYPEPLVRLIEHVVGGGG